MAIIPVGDDAFGNGSYEPIPVGTKLRVSVFEIEKTTVQNGDNAGQPQFVFTAKVTEDGAFKGREIKYNYVPLYAAAKNAWSLVAFAEAVGWKTEKGAGVDVPDNLAEVLGTEFIAKIGQTNSQKTNPETGQPYVNNRVTGYQKVKGDGAPSTPSTEPPSWGSL